MKKKEKERINQEVRKEEQRFQYFILLYVFVTAALLIFLSDMIESMSADRLTNFKSTVGLIGNLVAIVSFPAGLILFITTDRNQRMKNIRKWKTKALKSKKKSADKINNE